MQQNMGLRYGKINHPLYKEEHYLFREIQRECENTAYFKRLSFPHLGITFHKYIHFIWINCPNSWKVNFLMKSQILTKNYMNQIRPNNKIEWCHNGMSQKQTKDKLQMEQQLRQQQWTVWSAADHLI